MANCWYNAANHNEGSNDTDQQATGNSLSVGIGSYMTF